MGRRSAAIDFTKEPPIYFRDSKRMLPGAPPGSTVKRWHYVGIKGSTGSPVKIEARMAPGGMATTMAAYRRFINKLNGE